MLVKKPGCLFEAHCVLSCNMEEHKAEGHHPAFFFPMPQKGMGTLAGTDLHSLQHLIRHSPRPCVSKQGDELRQLLVATVHTLL